MAKAKFKKAIKIILICLAVALGCGFLVLYIVDKELALNILDKIMEYANKPLPIVGVSALVVAGLIWKIFSASSYGKKAIAKMKAEYESEKAEIEEKHKIAETKLNAVILKQDQQIDLLTNSVVSSLKAIPNKKVQAIANKLEVDIGVIKNSIKAEIEEIADSNVKLLIESKDELTNKIVEKVTKEIIDKYGEEKAINVSKEE